MLDQLTRALASELPFEPTAQQAALGAALVRWCSTLTAPGEPQRVFILNGYAGTGKTSVVGALVRALRSLGRQSVLLASTGRAAKVLGANTGMPAYTIHRKIYRAPTVGELAAGGFLPANNPHTDTFFIVDEASMIGGSGESLLEDLIAYVYSGSGCRLILVGDTAQLPPVGTDLSPAMDADILRRMGLKVTRAEITQTVRQRRGSGILYNATLLRHTMAPLLAPPKPEEPSEASENQGSAPIVLRVPKTPKTPIELDPPRLVTDRFADVTRVDPTELPEELEASYDRYGVEGTIVITGSNRRAVAFNQAIRQQILEREQLLVPGERLIIAKNNYFWSRPHPELTPADTSSDSPDSPLNINHSTLNIPSGFLANGQAVEVVRVIGTEDRHEVRFADVILSLGPGEPEFQAKIVCDALTAEDPALPAEIERELAYIAYEDAALRSDASPTAANRALRQSPYYNALRVKYAYAVTCHKAQGGQWPSVFVDPGGTGPSAAGSLAYYRWLYTAVTRATRHLTLIAPDTDT